MTKKIRQYVLAGANSGLTTTTGYNKTTFETSGRLLKMPDNNTPISTVVSFGIQAPEGTRFYVNGSSTPCVVGKTGIFEWDTEGYGYVTDLYFELKNHTLENDEYILVNICYLD